MGVGIPVNFHVYLKSKFCSEFVLLMRTERFYPNFINVIFYLILEFLYKSYQVTNIFVQKIIL